MVKVIVLGHGLIPRGKGIAPCKTPFEADKNMIKLMLQQGGLIVKIYNPNTDKYDRCTFANFERLYDAYSAGVKNVETNKDTKGLQITTKDISNKSGKKEEVSNAVKAAFENTIPVTTTDTTEASTTTTDEERVSDYSSKKEKYDKKNKKNNNGNVFKPVNSDEEPKG